MSWINFGSITAILLSLIMVLFFIIVIWYLSKHKKNSPILYVSIGIILLLFIVTMVSLTIYSNMKNDEVKFNNKINNECTFL